MFSEVAWAGSSVSSADEWFELVNISAQAVKARGWSIWFQQAGEMKEMLSLPEMEVYPGQKILVGNNLPDHQFSRGESVLDTTPTIVSSKVSLSNSALRIEIRNDQNQTVDVAGDGGEPLAGDRSIPATMERIRFDLSGDTESAWTTTTLVNGYDQGVPDLGTPEATVELTISEEEEVTEPETITEEASTEEHAKSAIGLKEALNSDQSNLVQAVVSVPLGQYHSRRLIIAENEVAAELQVPSGFEISIDRGRVIRFMAHRSTADVPRLLLEDDQPVEQLNESSYQLELDSVTEPKIFQLVNLTGSITKKDRRTYVLTKNYEAQLTKKQGVVLPTLSDGQEVNLTGLIFEVNPLKVRILDSQDFAVASSPSEAEVIDDQVAAEDISAEEEPIDEEIVVLEDDDSADETDDSPSSTAPGQILGAHSDRQPGQMWPLVVSGLTLFVALIIVGDFVWQRLIIKQQQWNSFADLPEN